MTKNTNNLTDDKIIESLSALRDEIIDSFAKTGSLIGDVARNALDSMKISEKSVEATKSMQNSLVELIHTVNDVDFKKTEFERGDIVLAKSFDGKKYMRGKIVGFGTGKRIFVATLFGHLIANEHDTFLIKRQPKKEIKK